MRFSSQMKDFWNNQQALLSTLHPANWWPPDQSCPRTLCHSGMGKTRPAGRIWRVNCPSGGYHCADQPSLLVSPTADWQARPEELNVNVPSSQEWYISCQLVKSAFHHWEFFNKKKILVLPAFTRFLHGLMWKAKKNKNFNPEDRAQVEHRSSQHKKLPSAKSWMPRTGGLKY